MSLRLSPLILALSLGLLSACSGAKPAPQASSAPNQETSVQLVRRMGYGSNLGNTLEATGDWIKGTQVRDYETAWGAPETTRAIIAQYKTAGFKSLRIPVAWSNLMGPNYTIHAPLMDRVQQVVDWALAEGLVVVVNIHWDGGWWHKFPKEEAESMRRYRRLWGQIADRFKAYPEDLVFESLNEELCFSDLWDRYKPGNPEGKAAAYALALRINQAFVDLVRASGGMNARRHLLIAGYCTDVDLTVDPLFQMPKDPAGRQILSVHYYTPFTFAGLEKDADWGKARPTWGTPADLAELDANIAKLKARFLDQGIPIIMGEYGAEKRNKEPESVRRYILTVAERLHNVGICPMLWDVGQHLNRRTGAWDDPELGKGFARLMAKGRQASGAGR